MNYATQITAAGVLAIGMALTGCSDSAEDVDRAGEDLSRATDNMVESGKRAANEAAEETGKFIDRAGEGLSEAGARAKELGKTALNKTGEMASKAGDAMQEMGNDGERALRDELTAPDYNEGIEDPVEVE